MPHHHYQFKQTDDEQGGQQKISIAINQINFINNRRMSDLDSNNPEFRQTAIVNQDQENSLDAGIRFEYNNACRVVAFAEKANDEYKETHQRWDQLRSKIKGLKLDNIGTRTYKKGNQDAIKAHNSMFMFNNEPIPPKLQSQYTEGMKQAIPVPKTPKNIHSQPKIFDQKEEMKRIYRSKNGNAMVTECSQAPKLQTQISKSRVLSRHIQRQNNTYLPQETHRTHNYLNAYKKHRPSTEQLSKRNYNKSPSANNFTHSHSKGINNDLINISMVSEADFTNRQIVRRKSNINGSLIEVIEASLLSMSSLSRNTTLIMFTMDRTPASSKFSNFRLIIGPKEIKELSEKFKLKKEEIATLAGTLVDYLELQQGHLKLSKDLFKKNVFDDQEGIKLAFETNPLVRLVTPRQNRKVRNAFSSKQEYFKKMETDNHAIINKEEFENIRNYQTRYFMETDRPIKELTQPHTINNVSKVNESIHNNDSQQIQELNEVPNQSQIPNESQVPNQSQIPNESYMSNQIIENSNAIIQQKLDTIKSGRNNMIQSKKDS